MRQASFKCEMPRLKLKSSRTFLAIKRCERTKIGKVIKQSLSSKLRWMHICAHSHIPVNILLWCGGAYGGTPYTITLEQVRVDLKENWGGAEPQQCCNVMVDAPNLHRFHPTSMSYVYTVFQHLDILWMGIWVYPYTVTSVQVRSGV